MMTISFSLYAHDHMCTKGEQGDHWWVHPYPISECVLLVESTCTYHQELEEKQMKSKLSSERLFELRTGISDVRLRIHEELKMEQQDGTPQHIQEITKKAEEHVSKALDHLDEYLARRIQEELRNDDVPR